MAIIKSIAFDEDDKAYKLFKAKFEGKRDFSSWVRDKIVEEDDMSLDPIHIVSKINELNEQVNGINSQIRKWKELLAEANRIKESQNEMITKISDLQDEPDFELELKKYKGYFKLYFGVIDNDELIKEFLDFKVPIEDLTLAYIKFAQQKKLKFVKPFPFLSKYVESEKIEVLI